jgi:hypothetical protein
VVAVETVVVPLEIVIAVMSVSSFQDLEPSRPTRRVGIGGASAIDPKCGTARQLVVSVAEDAFSGLWQTIRLPISAISAATASLDQHVCHEHRRAAGGT